MSPPSTVQTLHIERTQKEIAAPQICRGISLRQVGGLAVLHPSTLPTNVIWWKVALFHTGKVVWQTRPRIKSCLLMGGYQTQMMLRACDLGLSRLGEVAWATARKACEDTLRESIPFGADHTHPAYPLLPTNQPTDQPINPPTNQPANQPTKGLQSLKLGSFPLALVRSWSALHQKTSRQLPNFPRGPKTVTTSARPGFTRSRAHPKALL